MSKHSTHTQQDSMREESADLLSRETDGYVRDAAQTVSDATWERPHATVREVPDSVALADLSAGYDPGQSEHTADVRYLADALTRDLTSGVDED